VRALHFLFKSSLPHLLISVSYQSRAGFHPQQSHYHSLLYGGIPCGVVDLCDGLTPLDVGAGGSEVAEDGAAAGRPNSRRMETQALG
jgi:hypothetical protein